MLESTYWVGFIRGFAPSGGNGRFDDAWIAIYSKDMRKNIFVVFIGTHHAEHDGYFGIAEIIFRGS